MTVDFGKRVVEQEGMRWPLANGKLLSMHAVEKPTRMVVDFGEGRTWSTLSFNTVFNQMDGYCRSVAVMPLAHPVSRSDLRTKALAALDELQVTDEAIRSKINSMPDWSPEASFVAIGRTYEDFEVVVRARPASENYWNLSIGISDSKQFTTTE